MSSQKKSNTSSKQSLKTDVKGQLSEFYKVAKEKLLAVKNDVQTAKKEYEAQKEKNRKKELEYNDLLNESKELDIKIKGMNEKLIIAKRNASNLESQINLTKSEINTANSEIDFLKLETDNKVKRVQNESKKINVVKDNQMKTIQERIDKEKEINKELLQKIKEVEARIKELTYSIDNAEVQENKKNNALLNEAAEMNKFLSEL
jgi:chromosome segregation ATPase